ncbi:cysteine desulfurase NifS [Candidatus Marinamargulisbacteria bacterium SCGC AG-343-D04]|nr:cysteine desulfurase NifS [Candidatus Marinamargulisbacteria bacterium SCGC AG-343-D04]
MKKKRIYCDHNATTPVLPEVQKVYVKGLKIYGNPSSLYYEGRVAKEMIECARESFSAHIGCERDRVLFCSSGTEANNQVLRHLIEEKVMGQKPVHLLISAIEHSSIDVTARVLARYGIDYDVVPVDEKGCIDIEAYRAMFTPHTRLVSMMMANNEIGTIQSIKKLAEIAHKKGALFHTDAVQALGKCEIDVEDLGVDFMSFSAHKIYAPKGVGALYFKNEKTLTQLLSGGHHEHSLRASTENVPGIMAFEAAIKAIDVPNYQAVTGALVKQFKEGLESFSQVRFNTDISCSLSNTLSVSIEGCDGHALAMNCDLAGINVSTGSACSVGSIEASHVLKAIGVSDELNKSTLRFSFGLSNTSEEIAVLVEQLNIIMKRML